MSFGKFKSVRGINTGGGDYSSKGILLSIKDNEQVPFSLVKINGSPVFSKGF